jgi:uncharacterized protein YgiM (DUF1202 family)
MKNQGIKIALVIFGVLALGIGAYFIFKDKKEDELEDKKEKDDDDDDEKDDDDKNPFVKHQVTTKKGNLNLRETASTTSIVKQSLPKGLEILARPSEFQGWHEVSEDGKKGVGYVSSQFVTKK